MNSSQPNSQRNLPAVQLQRPLESSLSADWTSTVPRATGVPSWIQDGSIGMSGSSSVTAEAD